MSTYGVLYDRGMMEVLSGELDGYYWSRREIPPALEDLVLLKLDANRPVDIDDILSIKDAFGATLDYAYLDSWADQLRIRDRLDLYFDRSAR